MSAGFRSRIDADPNLRMTGSPYDSVRQFIDQGGLPQERAGYILARQALYMLQERAASTGQYVDMALHQLTDDETADLHQPPLNDGLKSIAIDHIAHHEYVGLPHLAKTSGATTALLLNMVIDHGSRAGESFSG